MHLSSPPPLSPSDISSYFIFLQEGTPANLASHVPLLALPSASETVPTPKKKFKRSADHRRRRDRHKGRGGWRYILCDDEPQRESSPEDDLDRRIAWAIKLENGPAERRRVHAQRLAWKKKKREEAKKKWEEEQQQKAEKQRELEEEGTKMEESTMEEGGERAVLQEEEIVQDSEGELWDANAFIDAFAI